MLEPELMVKMGSGVLHGVVALERAVEALAEKALDKATAETELDALRNNLTVLAAAWGSNANNDPERAAADAWRNASDALDELLKAG